MNISIALILPEQVGKTIEEALRDHVEHMKSVVPSKRWSIPLVSFQTDTTTLEDFVQKKPPLRQQWVQTTKLLSIGEGAIKNELWVHIQQTPAIQEFQKSIAAYAEEHNMNDVRITPTPHIFLGEYEAQSALGIPDSPLNMSFGIQEVAIVQEDPYEILGNIAVTP